MRLGVVFPQHEIETDPAVLRDFAVIEAFAAAYH